MAMPRTITRGLETVGLYSNRLMAESLAAKIRAESHNLESLHLLPPLGLPFVPQTSFALSASAIRIILNDVVLHQRRCVVELGSGISTLYLSKILSERANSHLITVDHDADWLARIGEMLRRIGSAAVVQLVHAPLEPVADSAGARWYCQAAIERALLGPFVDSVIVDGPKARGPDDAETRRPALAAVAPYLNSEGAVVFLDDVKRGGERRIYERWSADFDLERVPDAEFCGLGILVPRGRPLKFKIV